jgi:NADH:ubiquinone oxidoreductase subunit 2 (subunit N)
MGLSCGTLEGLASTFIYLFIYTVMNAIFFILLIRISLLNRHFYYFSDMNHLCKFEPLSAILLLIVLCSMGGFPPFGGFFAKYCLIFAAINSGLYSLVFFSLLVSAISGYYYLKLIKAIFFDYSNKFKGFNLIKKKHVNFFLDVLLLILINILLSFGLIVSEVYNILIIYSLDYFAPFF